MLLKHNLPKMGGFLSVSSLDSQLAKVQRLNFAAMKSGYTNNTKSELGVTQKSDHVGCPQWVTRSKLSSRLSAGHRLTVFPSTGRTDYRIRPTNRWTRAAGACFSSRMIRRRVVLIRAAASTSQSFGGFVYYEQSKPS